MAEAEPLRILVVEDEAETARSLERLLEKRFDASVVIAPDAISAMDHLLNDSFDLITLDYEMPDCDGLAVLKEITEMRGAPPVVMITGRGDEGVAAGAFRTGAVDYVMKDQKLSRTLPVAVGRALTETRLKKAERALAESERKYRDLVENLREGIWSIDRDARTIFVNTRMAEMLGTSVDEMIGDPLSGFMDERSAEIAIRNIEMLEGGSATHIEFELVRKDRKRIYVSVESSPIEDDEGHFVGVLWGVTDITARRQAERDLLRVNAELDGFAQTVSHDLKGPMSAIRIAGETLLSLMGAPQTEVTRSAVGEVQKVLSLNVDKSSSLIDDVLRLAEAGQVPAEVERVEIRGIVDRILEERTAEIEEKGISGRVGDDLGSVIANPTQVYQLFANLISNSIKHNKSEDPVLTISRVGENGDGAHRYLVRDNGPGIAPENIDKIFIPFFKGSEDGSGIGLSTVAKIVKVYGGEIKAYNDGGACFEFTLRDWDPEVPKPERG